MEIVRYAPTLDVDEGLVLEHGKTYLVEAVSSSRLSGVSFSIVGYTYGHRHKEHYKFPASHFRTPDGKRADLVRARAGTKAFDQYGDVTLRLTGFALVQGKEMVWCSEYTSATEPSLRPLPYDMFEHV